VGDLMEERRQEGEGIEIGIDRDAVRIERPARRTMVAEFGAAGRRDPHGEPIGDEEPLDVGHSGGGQVGPDDRDGGRPLRRRVTPARRLNEGDSQRRPRLVW